MRSIEQVVDRTLEEEVRILRRVVARQMSKVVDGELIVRVQGKVKGINPETNIELRLLEVPPPDSILPAELPQFTNLAFQSAERKREQLGYKKVVSVDFDSKSWKAKFEV